MLRTLTFGDVDSGFWGAAWDLGDGRPGFALVYGTAASGAALRSDWSITGDGVELESSPSGDPTALEDGFDQLVVVRGRLRIGDAERAVDCLGRRGARPALDPNGYESVRDVSAWFGPEDGLGVVAARPGGSSGQDDDLLTVSAFEAGQPLPIDDPRLSTTYAADGSPIRAGVELWLEQPEDDSDTADDRVQYPRRAAGEAIGNAARAVAGQLAVEARLFRWHARGQQGAGVYVLARSR